MADEPLTAQELRALAANAQIVEAELAAARVALADAGAREAELVDVLWRALAAVMAHGKDGGCQDCINVAKAIEAVVASPSAAAEGFRLMMRVECSALRAAGFSWAAGYIERLADAAGVRWRRENPQQEGESDGK